MALGSDVLRLIIDADSKGAVQEFDKLGKSIKSSVGDVETQAKGLSGKIGSAFEGLASKSSTVSGIFDKVGISGQQAGAAIATALPAAGLAAGAALVAFAKKGVDAFQETALAAGKFSDTTGLAVDTASRYIAVADDIGVGAGTIQSAFLKMEKAIGTNKAAFSGLIATAKDGGTDLSQTFLNAITHLQGIKDPIERATEASKLFGKGFGEVSELINTDAGKIKSALDGVSKAQVISPEELAKARAYRAAMDNLHDSVRDLSITVGSSLVASLATAANFAADLVNALNKIPGGAKLIEGGLAGYGELAKTFSRTVEGAGQVKGAFDQVNGALAAGTVNAGGWGASVASAKEAAAASGSAVGMLASNYEHLNEAMDANIAKQLGLIDSTMAQHSAQQAVIDAQANLNSVMASGTATTLQQQIATDKVVSSSIVLAAKNKEVETSAHGAEAGNQAFIGTLQVIANSSSPAVKAQLEGVIAKLKETGAQHPNPTVSVNDQASDTLARVRSALDGIKSGATFSIGANVSSAKAAVNGLINGLNSISSITGKHFATIAKGTKNFPGGLALVGERGPELAFIPKGTQVKTAAETKAIMDGPTLSPVSSSSSASTVVINFNGLVTDEIAVGREIKRVLARAGYSGVN